MGPDGYPRPPECVGHDPHARRPPLPPRATSVPATPLKWDGIPGNLEDVGLLSMEGKIKFLGTQKAKPARSNNGSLRCGASHRCLSEPLWTGDRLNEKERQG
jgi:hypothetical protein